jgi:DNA-binding LacI/PurR family transcriptional regulator
MVTIKDIAKATGVSVGTISKVISQSEEFGRISPATVKKIRQRAREMGYRPNVNARALVSRKSMILGVYVAPHPGDRIDSLYTSSLIEGICRAARENHYDVLLIDFGSTDTDIHRTQETFLTKRVDGVILIYFSGDTQVVESMTSVGMPLVAIGNYPVQTLNSVNLDNAAGITAVVQHLHALGHREIAFLSELTDSVLIAHIQRKEAFASAIRKFQIEDRCMIVGFPEFDHKIVREGPFCQEDGYWGTDFLLKAGRKFTALVCYNDLVAMGAMRRINEAGLKIPSQVAITGFDNTFISAYLTPPLTTVEHPTRQMGAQAVRMLLESINNSGRETATQTVMLKPELVPRQSTEERKNP